MRILWVEDFDGATPESLIGELFPFADEFAGELATLIEQSRRSITTETEWCDFYDEIGDAFHEIRPVVHETQFRKILESGWLIENFDLVLIDINLINGFFDKLPDGVELEFEGKWVYQKLLQKSFPSERMAFLTANKDKVPVIAQQLRSLCIENLVAFGKEESPRLNRWLQEKDEDYLRLRRGVLDGQQFAHHLIGNAYEPVFPPDNPFSINELCNYLDSIRVEFQNPKLPPADFTTLPKFLKQIVILWERSTRGKESSAIQTAMHYTLKNVRNWCTHNRMTIVSPQDVAVLFILNMRAVFNDQSSQLRRYERVLLKLFRPVSEISPQQLVDSLTDAYRAAWHDYDVKVAKEENDYEGNRLSWETESRDGIKREVRSFNDICNKLVDAATEGAIPRRQLLTQCFWVVLGGSPRGKGRLATVALPQPLAPDWNQQLLLATFSHCFPGYNKTAENPA